MLLARKSKSNSTHEDLSYAQIGCYEQDIIDFDILSEGAL
jgi:hypothetical protein